MTMQRIKALIRLYEYIVGIALHPHAHNWIENMGKWRSEQLSDYSTAGVFALFMTHIFEFQVSFIYIAFFSYRQFDKAALHKSGYRFRSLMKKPEKTVTRKILPETTWGKNLETNLTQKGTCPLQGDTGSCDYKSLNHYSSTTVYSGIRSGDE